jgi:hypothetical protein
MLPPASSSRGEARTKRTENIFCRVMREVVGKIFRHLRDLAQAPKLLELCEL